MRRVLTFVLVASALAAAACGGDSSTAPTTTIATATKTETFTGTVPYIAGSDNGSSPVNVFTMSTSGEVDLVLVSVGPPATITMGINIGIPTGGTCPLNITGQLQASPTSITPGTLNAGTYCVTVYDIGNQSQDVTYTLTVTHPV